MSNRPRDAARPRSAVADKDRRITSAIELWFAGAARALPWRRIDASFPGWRRNPYHSLVSEAMLQQTQVSRVIDRFTEFVRAFPTIKALADASEHEVLGLWSGLGYYRRARSLHAAAKLIQSDFAGEMPKDVADLLRLPGVGAYTAGALASIAGEIRTPLVDGNVVRVLLRIEGKEGNAGRKDTMEWVWKRAAALVDQSRDPGVFNEGMMELGALICTPESPACRRCPAAALCKARAEGSQTRIPSPRQASARRDLHCISLIVHDPQGRVLMRRRAPEGMWAGMWQTPTLESNDLEPSDPSLAAWLAQFTGSTAGKSRRAAAVDVVEVARFIHETTHRRVHFRVMRAAVSLKVLQEDETQSWLMLEQALRLPLSSAQSRVLSYMSNDAVLPSNAKARNAVKLRLAAESV